jgi:hypothetical protein
MAALLLSLVAGACGDRNGTATTQAGTGGVVFGIYPGSGIEGTNLEGVAQTLSVLTELKAPGRPFLVHLYSGYGGRLPWRKYRGYLGKELGSFERAGFDVELVLRYAPADRGGSLKDVRAFVALVRRTVETFGSERRFVSIQITNEPDRIAGPASDGYFNRRDHAWQALIRGVIAAKATARARHYDQLKVGFNYGAHNEAFWRYLGQHGGAEFRSALDWIGIDTYPGTVAPLDSDNLQTGISRAIGATLYAARHMYMPLARLPVGVALHFSENGYATSRGHSYGMQATALKAAVRTVASVSRAYRVTEYNWFELRDASSSTHSISDQLGLLQADYRPKPAFATYRQLIRDP